MDVPAGLIRSGASIKGYEVKASDGPCGTVAWASYAPGESYLVVTVRHHLHPTHHVIPAGAVATVDPDGRKLRLSVSRREVEQAPQRPGHHSTRTKRTLYRANKVLLWPERTAVTADCRQPRAAPARPHAEAVPIAGCSCGIYAARHVETAIAYADCCDLDADGVLCRTTKPPGQLSSASAASWASNRSCGWSRFPTKTPRSGFASSVPRRSGSAVATSTRTHKSATEVLPADEYEYERLPGATNIPLKTLNAETASRLDRDRPVIVYCYDQQ